MRSRVTYSLAAFLLLLACLGAPGVALAETDGGGTPAASSSVDLSGVEDGISVLASKLDTLSGDASGVSVSVDALSTKLDVLSADVSQTGDDQATTLDEVKGLREDLASVALTDEERSALVSADERLGQLVELATPEEAPEDEPPYMTIEGIGQLLMLNTACLAVLVGIKAFEIFWSAIGGAGRD